MLLFFYCFSDELSRRVFIFFHNLQKYKIMPAEKRVVKKKARKEPAGNSEFLDERTSQKILKIVAVQQQEEENESRLPVDTIGATRQEASDDEVSSNGEEEEDMDEYNALLEIQLDPEQVYSTIIPNIPSSLLWTSSCMLNQVTYPTQSRTR